MNKARVILITLGILATVGGIFAFKIKRTGEPVITTTTAVNANLTRYTLPGAATFCWTRSDMFFTNDTNAGLGINLLTTTTFPTGLLTLRRVGGTETITIPNYCTVTANVPLTRVTAFD